MNGWEKSDSAIVATKPANKASNLAAEWVEPRAGTKGNTGQPHTRRAQNRASVPQGLERVRQAARQRKKERFTALLHHVSADRLRESFYALKRNAAPGVDGRLARRVAQRARSEAARLAGAFRARLRNGHVRECHGDLHLGNIVLLDGVPTPFDCLEFEAALRWTDTISDLAFPVMDLLHHGRPALAYRLLNGYLEQSGDYGALAVLPFYLAMRALVRARVLLERACQQHAAGASMAPAQAEAGRLLALAWRCLNRRRGPMVLMHGLSGSGKSTAAAQMSEAGAMVRVRSDAVRKSLHRGVAPASGWYAASETARTYRRLLAVCRLGCRAGFPMIADATFLVRAERERFAAQALRLGVPFAIVTCEASPETLRARIAARARAGRDLSDADNGVLAWQMRVQEPLTEAERACVASPGSFMGRATPGCG
nr:bifunctional aminoglycoside phosphotransferase/ATP-binding protein [Cupriavidus taiwanensis]